MSPFVLALVSKATSVLYNGLGVESSRVTFVSFLCPHNSSREMSIYLYERQWGTQKVHVTCPQVLT